MDVEFQVITESKSIRLHVEGQSRVYSDMVDENLVLTIKCFKTNKFLTISLTKSEATFFSKKIVESLPNLLD